MANPNSVTGPLPVRAATRSTFPPSAARPNGKSLEIVGARGHNLKNVSVCIPAGLLRLRHGRFRVGQVHADSGDAVPAPAIRHQQDATPSGSRTTRSRGIEHLDKIVDIDQSPIGRTPRSNPATYTGVFDMIRDLFAKTADARMRGYKAGRFSFNVKGGRCEACKGDGIIKIEMQFLPDVYVPCEVCHGKRYNRETLEVKYKGKTIADVLDMTVGQAVRVLRGRPRHHAQAAGPSTMSAWTISAWASPPPSFPAAKPSASNWRPNLPSAPPARRSTSWTSRPPACTSPTSRSCSHVLQRLADTGNTVLVIEHNLDVIKTADWVIDMGPEGGDGGGTVVAAGHARRGRPGQSLPHRPLPRQSPGRPEPDCREVSRVCLTGRRWSGR